MRFRNKSFKFLVLILFVFTLLTYQGIKGKSSTVYFPLYPIHLISKGGSVISQKVRNFFISDRAKENKMLLDTIKRLEQEKNRCIEAENENKRLRSLLELKSERHDFIASAEVFARDPTNWFHVLWINKGSEDRVSKEMVAVTPVGVVGRIYNVFSSKSSVILITDVNSAVAVRIQPSGADAILEGRGDNMSFLKYVSRDTDVEVGQRVVTSGLDGIYPEGLLIGYVERVRKMDGDFFQDVVVRPAQNLNAVEEVAILKR